MYTLGGIAQQLGLTLLGDPERRITGLASLLSARAGQLSFYDKRADLSQLENSDACAVILQPEFRDHCNADQLHSKQPYLSFARATRLFAATPPVAPGVHHTAIVAAGARVDALATIGPHACISAGAQIAAGVRVGAGCCIGENSSLGRDTIVHANATLYDDVRVGSDCVLHSGVVVGADGFGFVRGEEGWEKFCQLGGVRIGDRVEIGACSSIDRGALDHTVIEDGVIIDNQVQIAHNCHVGRNTAIAGCVGLAGSSVIGANCTLAGGVGVVGHLTICDNVHITGMTMVTRSISRPGSYSSGTPMMKTQQWRRSAARFARLSKRRNAPAEKFPDAARSSTNDGC